MEETKRRVRRRHANDLKKAVLDECRAGVSVASVAMAHGINANLVHKWRRLEQCAVVPTRSVATPAMPTQTFIPLVIGTPRCPYPAIPKIDPRPFTFLYGSCLLSFVRILTQPFRSPVHFQPWIATERS